MKTSPERYRRKRFTLAGTLALLCFMGPPTAAWGQSITKVEKPPQKLDLKAHEALGGHTVARHVGQDAHFIKSRVIQGEFDEASTFPDLETAEAACQAVMETHRVEINRTLFSSEPWRGPSTIPYQHDVGEDIGSYLSAVNVKDSRGRVRKAKALKSGVTSVTLVLRYEKPPPRSFYVLTCYPTRQ